MARFNKMTGKIQGLAGRNAGRKARRFAKLAMRSRVTGKDIKRRLQDEASEGIKVGITEGGEFLDEDTGEEYKGVWHLDEETGVQVMDILLRLNREHKTTFIMITHNSSLASKMQFQYRMENGQLHSITKK